MCVCVFFFFNLGLGEFWSLRGLGELVFGGASGGAQGLGCFVGLFCVNSWIVGGFWGMILPDSGFLGSLWSLGGRGLRAGMFKP